MEKKGGVQLDLPGFRFHPTEEELIDFYLRRVVHGKKLNFDIIGTLNLYRYDPCELPGMAKIGEREWYFFVPRDRRSANGGRPNRTTERGFWKATGSDRPVRSAVDPKRLIGLKKTLVFYQGRAPRGMKTDWVMNEYRLPDDYTTTTGTIPKEDIVLCKIYRKATSLKELEQRAAMEEEQRATAEEGATQLQLCFDVGDTLSCDGHENFPISSTPPEEINTKEMMNEGVKREVEVTSASSPKQSVYLPEIQVPSYSLEWMQDPLLAQLRSPWLDHWSPYANMLNFQFAD
ncbi:putative NAC domain-containing protein 94 [Ananas comosus]|uniref:Putative NAC domain-containing protein 94 n=1 Tax=Ananas comosus TaxID=4615 RepID=A0A199UJH6_ANACO|nr:putative NAC domain-containing protein 94 [Ananas comosus]